MHTIAVVITKTFNPFVTSLAAVALVIFSQQISTGQKILWFVLGILVAAAPTAILYLGARRGQVTSFWAPEGKERTKAFLTWVGVAFFYVVLAYLVAAPKLVLALGLVLLILGLINLVVSSSFKLSVHSELVTLLTLIGILAISVNFILFVLLIILVGWSRIYLKDHTLSEVSFGVLASVVAVYLVFALLGLVTF